MQLFLLIAFLIQVIRHAHNAVHCPNTYAFLRIKSDRFPKWVQEFTDRHIDAAFKHHYSR